jgi:hypothetical protein
MLLEGLYNIVQIGSILFKTDEFDQVGLSGWANELRLVIDVTHCELRVEAAYFLHLLLHLNY